MRSGVLVAFFLTSICLAGTAAPAVAADPARPAVVPVDLDAFAARADMLGMRLGMTREQILERIKAEYPDRPIQTGTITEPDSGKRYDGVLIVRETAESRLMVQFAPPQEGGGAVVLKRSHTYFRYEAGRQEGQAPTQEAMDQALKSKYGEPTAVFAFAGTDPYYYWAFDDKGGKIADRSGVQRCETDNGRNDGLMSGVPGCGVFAMAYPFLEIVPPQQRSGPRLVYKLEVLVADHRVLNAISARLDREAAETAAVKRRAVTAGVPPRL